MSSTDIQHFPRRDRATLTNLIGPEAADQYIKDEDEYRKYRVWELSMDEVNGLVTIYWIVNKLSHDASITTSVQRQASFLGNYLANNGYLLVRPMGGLSWRGATGLLPALEYPFARVLGSVGGLNASSRADFRQAMEKAGYWRNLEGPIANLQLAAWATISGGALAALSTVAVAAGFAVSIESIISGQALSPSTVGGAAAVAMHSDCFDVSEPSEPALALLFKEAPNKRALYRLVARLAAEGSSPGAHFHSWIGLTGLDDPEPTVRDPFRVWYAQRRQWVEREKSKNSYTPF